MAQPIIGANIDFSNGAGFISTAFTLDDATKGKLGTGQLADANAWVDISDILLSISTRRGRSRILSQFEAGTASVTLADYNGDWNASNTASPYYGKLIPLRKIQIWCDYKGIRYYLFSGFITDYISSFAQGVDEVYQVTLKCVDGFKLLNGVAVDTVSGTPAGQYSGARINALLDYADWPSALRAVDTGDSTLQADPATPNRNLLQCLQLVEQSEMGGFYIASNGDATFLSRTAVEEFYDTTPYYFSDDGLGIPYANVTTAQDDTILVNDVTVTRAGGTAQNVYDQTSIDKYFIHSGVRTGILVQTDTEALNQAKMLLASRKETELRVESMMLNLLDTSSVELIEAGLSLELLDYLQVKKTLSGSTEITRDVLVQGIGFDGSKNSFMATVYTGEPLVKGFLLDSTSQGILGTNVLSY